MEQQLEGGAATGQGAALTGERETRLPFGVFDDFPMFVYLQRRDYTVAYANKKVRQLYGDAEGKLCYQVFANRASPCPDCQTFKVFADGSPVEWEFTDGNGRSFLIYDYPYEDESGEPLVMELGIDVTELKQVQKELYQAQKLKAIGVLAGGIAHDLNNNLVPIIFNIDYALGRINEEAARESLGDALLAAQKAARLVEQVLEYSRQQEVSRRPIRLGPLIRESVKEFRRSLPAHISLSLEVNSTADSVLGNPGQLQQIFVNLLKNAEQAMPDGGTIAVTLSEKSEPLPATGASSSRSAGKYVTLEISDTGVGIREENIGVIFEPFYTSRKSDGGTGMGLAVVHSIVTSGGGTIEVNSTPGIGTTFTVLLPLVSPAHEQLQGEYCLLEGNDLVLLLVDDDPAVRTAMARSLRQAGFEVDSAGSARDGIDLFEKNPDRYGLVLVDQSMPDISGIEMSRRLLEIRGDCKIVICTGHIGPTLEGQAAMAGVSGFARKPMSPKTLIETIKRHCY
ncbi:MAG: response regulator [Desulfofustis sp.]|nr:response regulator [Desulfofustis sp.]